MDEALVCFAASGAFNEAFEASGRELSAASARSLARFERESKLIKTNQASDALSRRLSAESQSAIPAQVRLSNPLSGLQLEPAGDAHK